MQIKLTLNQIMHSMLSCQIESKLPNELLHMVFSILSNRDITSTYCVNKRWNAVSLDVVRIHEKKRFNSFIHFIAGNIAEKNKDTKAKIQNLITEIKLSEDGVINLSQIKNTLLDSKEKLIQLLKELDKDKQKTLSDLSENEIKPLHLQGTFDFADPVRRVRNLFRIIHLRHQLNILENRRRILPPLANRRLYPAIQDLPLADFIANLFPNRERDVIDVD